MKSKIFYGLIAALIAWILIEPASALTTQTFSFGNAMSMFGAYANLKVTMFFENIPSLSASDVTFYYELISLTVIGLVAVAADRLHSSIFQIITVITASIFAYFGWFTISGNAAATWTIIGFTAILTIVGYMTEQKKNTYGTNGAGDPTIMLFLFFAVLQIALGIVSSSAIFPTGSNLVAAPPSCGNNTYMQCQINGNTQLTGLVTNTGLAPITGGTAGDPVSQAAALVTMAWSLLVTVVEILISMALLPLVFAQAFPMFASNTLAMLFVGCIWLGAWIMWALMIFRWIFKPMFGEARL